MQFLLPEGCCRPVKKVRHQTGSIERRSSFKDYAEALSISIKGLNIFRKLFVFSTMREVFGAVLKQHAMKLLYMIFCKRYMLPGYEDSVHGPGISGHLLLIPGPERVHLQIGQQGLHLMIGQPGSLNTSRRAYRLDGCYPSE